MESIVKLDKIQLKELLKKLKLLNSLKKSLWKRALLEFNKINNWINFYKVEYFNSNYTDLSFIEKSVLEAFNKKFWLVLDLNQIKFVENNKLQWWFRIFCDDNMFDFSYSKIEKLLK